MASSGLTHEQTQRYAEDGFMSGHGVFTPEEVNRVRVLLEPFFDGFSDQKQFRENRSRDVGAVGALAAGSQQPEIDRPTKLNAALLDSAVFKKAHKLSEQLLGRSTRYVFDHAICKMPHTKTKTAWHQDRAYMMQNVELQTVNFWIPLQDVDEQNGTLGYVPGSHLGPLKRHHNDPNLHSHVRTVPLESEEPHFCIMKVGDFCAHHPLTLHGAGPNLTDKPRLAWSIHFGPYGRLEYLKPKNILPVLKRITGIEAP